MSKKLRKLRIQHIRPDETGQEVYEDVDVLTDAEAVTMDGKPLKEQVKALINERVSQIIDNAPEELDTLKEIADELQKNQSSTTTILKQLAKKQDALPEGQRGQILSYDEGWKPKTLEIDSPDLTGVVKTSDFNSFKDNIERLYPEIKSISGVNINSITKYGAYSCRSNTNLPSNAGKYGALLVLKADLTIDGTHTDTIQVYFSSDDKIFMRNSVDKSSGTWGSWKEIGKNVEIVNNLTSGGSDKALSAEVGKQINELLKPATTSKNGLLSASDKRKLNNMKTQVVLTEAEYKNLETQGNLNPETLYFIKD